METQAVTLEPPDTSRIQALSDGVFAVALTLLLTTFDVMKMPPGLSEEKVRALLASEWSDLLHFLESFVIVSAFWVEHHHQFHHIRRYDLRLGLLNALGLLMVVLVPVTNSLVGDYGDLWIAAALFEANLLAAGAVFYLTWLHATAGRRLVDPRLDERVIRGLRNRSALIPLAALAALAVSPLSPRWSTLVLFLVPVLLFLVSRGKRATARQA